MSKNRQFSAPNIRRLERRLKGAASSRRLRIMLLLKESGGLSLLEISQHLKWNPKTTNEHVRRLKVAGLISKRRRGPIVVHNLTRQGYTVLDFLQTLD